MPWTPPTTYTDDVSTWGAADVMALGTSLASHTDTSISDGTPISVKAPPYRAIGDGASHPLSERFGTLGAAQAVYSFVTALTQEIDRAAWQLALDAGSSSGRAVYGPAGTYLIDKDLLCDSNAYVFGDGWDTYLKMKGGVADGLAFRMFLPRTYLTALTTGIVIRDLHLDGQASLQNLGGPLLNPNNTQHGISLRNAERCRITRVWAENFDGDGIYLGRDTSSTPQNGGNDNIVESCYVNDNVRNGMMIGRGSRNIIRGNLFERNQVGMKIGDPKYAPQIYASAELDLEPNVTGEHCDHNTIVDNTFRDGWWVGIQISRPNPTEDNNIIRGNRFYNMRSTYLHGLGNGCTGTLVEGNTFDSTGGVTVTGTCSTTNGSANLTSVTPTTGWQNGMRITGAGIPAGASILSGAGTSTMVMTSTSAASPASPVLATATASGVGITGTTLATRFLRFTEGPDNRVVRNTFRGSLLTESSSHALDIDDAGGGDRPARFVLDGNIFDFAGSALAIRLTNCDDAQVSDNVYLNGAYIEESSCKRTVRTYRNDGMWISQSPIEIGHRMAAGLNTEPGPCVVWSADDGYTKQVDFFALLNARGIKGTFFCTPGWIGQGGTNGTWSDTYMTLAEAQAIAAAGHEVGTHAYLTHDNYVTYVGTFGETGLATMLQASKDWIETNLGVKVRTGAYPSGGNSARIREIVGRLHHFYRGTHEVLPRGVQNPFDVSCIDAQPVGVTEAILKAYVDQAVTDRCPVVFLTHGGMDATALTKMGNVMDYATSLAVPQKPFYDAMAERTQLIGGQAALENQGGMHLTKLRTERVEIFRQTTGNGATWVGLDVDETTAAPYIEIGGTVLNVKLEFRCPIVVKDNNNIDFGTSFGTRIGTATNQKLAFWNKTAIVQPTALPAAATDLATAITLVNDIRTKFTAIGLAA